MLLPQQSPTPSATRLSPSHQRGYVPTPSDRFQRPVRPSRSSSSGSGCQKTTRRYSAHLASTEEYVLLPNRLIELQRQAPTAIGVYALIARLFLAYKKPVPLSRHDLQAYDTSLSDGIKHVLDQLVSGGWLIKSKVASCRQSCYTPAWGLVAGEPRPWVVGPRLAKPRHIQAIALPRQILDTLMGRVSVFSSRPALIDRYFDGPALHLADVGAYALTQYGYPTPTPRLTWLGLVVDGHAVAPARDRDLLLRACQPSLEVPTCPELGPRGQQYLGWWQPVPVAAATTMHATTEVADPVGAAPAAPFFSPADLGEDLIGDLISQEATHEAAFCPSQAHEEQDAQDQDSSKVIPGNLQANYQAKSVHENPPSIPPYQGGGKGSSEQKSNRRRNASDPLPSSPAAQLLRAVDVRPDVIRELASQPEEIIQAAIADGRSRAGIRDLAGWVVSMVRDARDYGWGTALRIRGGTMRTADEEMQDRIARMKATGLFRSDDDLIEPRRGHVATAAEDLPVVPREVVLPQAGMPPVNRLRAEPAPVLPPAQLVALARQALRARVRPQLWPVVERLQIMPGAERWLLRCGQRQDQEVVRGQLLPLLGCVLKQLHPEPLRLLFLD
jgi:hypothetical protein